MSTTILAWPKCKNEKRNPFQSLLYQAIGELPGYKVEEFSPQNLLTTSGHALLHIHWPDVFLASASGGRFWLKLAFLRLVCLFAKFRRMPVVWTVHNLKRTGQHNTTKLNKYFWPWFSKRVDGLIYMTEASKYVAEDMFPFWQQKNNVVIPHGHYRPIFSSFPEVASFNSGNTKPQVLFFGSITKYKNVYKLLKAFLELPKGAATLAIKGEVSKDSPDDALLHRLSMLPSSRSAEVIFENRFLNDSELVLSIRACELVVFPYADVLNSGAAIFALSVGRPILASNTPLFQELQKMVGKEWVYLFDDKLDGAALLSAITNAQAVKIAGKQPDLSQFEWSVIAQQTIDFYQQVTNATKSNKQ